MKLLAIVLGSAVLAGCAHHPGDCALGVMWDDCLPGTKGFERRQDLIRAEQSASIQKDHRDDQKCQSYGARPGSDAYVSCRVEMGKQR